MNYVILIAGAYMVLLSMIMTTQNFRSFIVLRAPAMLFGLALLGHGAKLLGWL